MNYFVESFPPCKECGHVAERYHLGKSSAGWKFLFQVLWNGEHTIRSWKQWKNFIMCGSYLIVDEEYRVVYMKEFEEMIVSKQSEPLHHDLKNGSSLFKDSDGFWFDEDEFS